MKIVQKSLNYFILNIRHKSFLEIYNKLKKYQYQSIEKNQSQQLSNLNNLLNHAYEHIDYYHHLFQELDILKANRVQLNSVSELNKIPILTKEDKILYLDNFNTRNSLWYLLVFEMWYEKLKLKNRNYTRIIL